MMRHERTCVSTIQQLNSTLGQLAARIDVLEKAQGPQVVDNASSHGEFMGESHKKRKREDDDPMCL